VLAIAAAPALQDGVTSVAFAPDDVLVCASGRSVVAFDMRRADRAVIQKYGDRVWGAENFAEDEVNQISVFDDGDGAGNGSGGNNDPSRRQRWKIACCEDGGDVHVFNFPDQGQFGGVGSAGSSFSENSGAAKSQQQPQQQPQQQLHEDDGTIAVTHTKLTGVHSNLCTSARWMPGCRGRTLVSGSMDATICVWNVPRCKPVSDGGHITCGPADQGASTSGGSQLLNPPFVQCVDCSPYVCAAALGDGTVGLYDMAKLSSVGRLRGHSSATACVRFVPPSGANTNWEWLFSAGNDRNICLWNLSAGLATSPSCQVNSLAANGSLNDDWAIDMVGASVDKKKKGKNKNKKKRQKKKGKNRQQQHYQQQSVDDADQTASSHVPLDPSLVGLPLRFEHTHKINWLESQSLGGGGSLRLFVADESPIVTVYEGFL
jgi:WD40 repeat protein